MPTGLDQLAARRHDTHWRLSILIKDRSKGGWSRAAASRAFSSHNPASTLFLKLLAFLLDFLLPALCSQFPCLAGFPHSVLTVCAIPSCDWHPKASSICLLWHLPPASHSFTSTSSMPKLFSCHRPHLRGLCPGCLGCLPELETFAAPIFWSHAWRL